MDDAVIVRHLENLDRRLANVEQILPTLATKEDLRALATKEEIRTLATKDEIRTLATKDEIRSIKDEIRTLATKEELRTEIDRLQRHINIVGESLHSDIQLLADLVSVMPKGTGASS
jgi:uncharacterized protein YicC (UPF0701 family)